MNESTSISLLGRAADPSDSDSWDRLVELYVPLLRRWLRQYEVQDCDADDLTQDVLAVLMQELPKFEHNRQVGAFRNWLRRVLVNRLRNYWRDRQHRPPAQGGSTLAEQLNQLEDERSQLSRAWNEQHDRDVIASLMEVIRPRFQEKTWQAFHRQMFDGERPERIAAELQMGLGSVYMARNRVLSALRQEAAGLVDAI